MNFHAMRTVLAGSLLVLSAVFCAHLKLHKGWEIILSASGFTQSEYEGVYEFNLRSLDRKAGEIASSFPDRLLFKNALRTAKSICEVFEDGRPLVWDANLAVSPEQAGKFRRSGSRLYLTAGEGGDPRVNGRIYKLRLFRGIALKTFLPLFPLLLVLLFLPSLKKAFNSPRMLFLRVFLKESQNLIFKGHSDWAPYKIIFFTLIMLMLLAAPIKDQWWTFGYRNAGLFCDYYANAGLVDPDNRFLPGYHDNKYCTGVIWPPLSILLNTKLVGEKAMEEHKANNTGCLMLRQTFETDDYAFAKAISLIFLASFYLMFILYVNLNERNAALKSLFILVVMGLPGHLQAIISGNQIALSALFAAFYVFNYKHQDRLIREFALISLALAAGLKLYPAFLGLLVLYEKDYRALIRLVLYGVLSFIIPLLVLNSDLWLENLAVLMNNLRLFSQYEFPAFNWRLLTYNGYWGHWLHLSDFGLDSQAFTRIDRLLKLANYALAGLALLTNHGQEKSWKRVLQICLTFMLIVPISIHYITIFVLIPLILYFNEDKTNRRDLVYMVLGLAILAPRGFNLNPWANIFILRALAGQVLFFLLLYESSRGFIHMYLKKRQA